ncbi:methionine ABC transporter ATP-binding protein [Comamonas humi]
MTTMPPPVQVAPHIVFDGVGKSYPGAQAPALRAVSFDIRPAEVFGIIGRSGAGKSTLLRTINALELPTQGSVSIHGVDPATLGEDALVALRRKVGMIFQHFNLLSAKTVFENIALPLRVAGVRPALVKQRVDELLHLVGLADKAQAYPARLSGGQKQRVGIARALVHEPEVLLCDEATSALDPETTQSILALLRDINRKLGLTIVLITHDMAVIRAVCDRVLVLDRGEMQELGEVWRVFATPQAAATQALLQPLREDFPPELARALQARPDDYANQAVLRLGFNGARHATGLPLQALAVLGPGATLLHGGLDRIRGHAQGRLLVSLPASALLGGAAELEQLRQRIGADQLEVMGYAGSAA